MSQENLEMVRSANEAFNRGDYAGVFAEIAHPDFEYTTSALISGTGGVYRGAAGYGRFVTHVWGEFDDVRSQVDEVIDLGDRLVVSLTVRAQGRKRKAETSWTFTQVWTLLEGKVLRGEGFTTRELALEAAGFSPIGYWFSRIRDRFSPIGYWLGRIRDWFSPIGYWLGRIGDWFSPIGYWLGRIGDRFRPIGDWFSARVAAAVAVALLVIVAGVAGYLGGASRGVDVDAAQVTAAAEGQKRGAAEGQRRGYALGFESARESAYLRAYRDAYESAYLNEFEQAGIRAPNHVLVRGP